MSISIYLSIYLSIRISVYLSIYLSILYLPASSETDIAERAAEALRSSSVRNIIILGRRGVLQAAFTIKELRELSRLSGVRTTLHAPADAFSAAVLEEAGIFMCVCGLTRGR